VRAPAHFKVPPPSTVSEAPPGSKGWGKEEAMWILAAIVHLFGCCKKKNLAASEVLCGSQLSGSQY